MKIILYSIVIVLLINCKKETKQISYEFIENEIEIYIDLLSNKNGIYVRNKNKIMWDNINNLYGEIQSTNDLIDWHIGVLKGKELEEMYKKNIPEKLSKYLKEDYPNCFDDIGSFEEILKDTMYYHRMKLKYIKCILKSSSYIDSIPKLKERLEDFPQKPVGYYYNLPENMWYDTLVNGELKENVPHRSGGVSRWLIGGTPIRSK